MVDFNTEPRHCTVPGGSAQRVPAGAGNGYFLPGAPVAETLENTKLS